MVEPRESPYDLALREMDADSPDVVRALELLRTAYAAGDQRAAYALGTWHLHGKPPFVEIDERKALELIGEAAEALVPDALFDMAITLEKGALGLKADPEAAFLLYLKAALRGEEQSVFEVGRCYFYGIGTAKDRGVADVWLARAAELGYKDVKEESE